MCSTFNFISELVSKGRISLYDIHMLDKFDNTYWRKHPPPQLRADYQILNIRILQVIIAEISIKYYKNNKIIE